MENHDYCSWDGVHCNENGPKKETQYVTELVLPSNNVVGALPDVFADLPKLEVLNLRDNKVT
ncbi:MAG: hypothetical protein H6765_00965 [Candidatus Peribacteria bacterium]|nr:MAG: hypothetical protein H6765_00965 [Candidatus Peribacteria bacterium]